MFVASFTLLLLVAAFAVDQGLWLGERRISQKDADTAARGGAFAYLTDQFAHAEAIARAQATADANLADLSHDDTDWITSDQCHDYNGDFLFNGPSITVRIGEETGALFGNIFGIGGITVGAEATACVGSVRSMDHFTPFAIQSNPDVDQQPDYLRCFDDSTEPPTPLFGSVCVLRVAPGECVSGQCGYLSLHHDSCGTSGSSELGHYLIYGAAGTCSIGDEVETRTGQSVASLRHALNERLSFEIDPDYRPQTCDAQFGNNDTYDDFHEVFSVIGAGPVVPSPDNVFVENNCRLEVTATLGQGNNAQTMEYEFIPRLVNLIITDRFEQGSQTTTITGFAGFYLIGCVPGGEAESIKAEIEADFENNASQFLNRCTSNAPQQVVLGIFVKNLLPSGDVGDWDENLPRSIVLVR
jgi:hypothetical protein